jgi:hypothetical protein
LKMPNDKWQYNAVTIQRNDTQGWTVSGEGWYTRNYETASPDTPTEYINTLGAAGWELVGMHSRPAAGNVPESITLLLKRPVVETEHTGQVDEVFEALIKLGWELTISDGGRISATLQRSYDSLGGRVQDDNTIKWDNPEIAQELASAVAADEKERQRKEFIEVLRQRAKSASRSGS